MARTETFLAALALAALAVGPATAAGAVAAPPGNEFQAVCAAYGPGYHQVPGTQTCLRIGGYVQMDVTVSSSRSGNGNIDMPLKLPPAQH